MNLLSDLGLDPDNKLWVKDGTGQKHYLAVTFVGADNLPVLGLVKVDEELPIQPTLENMPVHADVQ